MDYISLLAILAFVLTHVWANIPAPKEDSNALWKALYSAVNTIIAGNYNHAKSMENIKNSIDLLSIFKKK